ncbi:MAG: PEP-CTERM sorting domain-containing protein [Terriglobales bacterium]
MKTRLLGRITVWGALVCGLALAAAPAVAGPVVWTFQNFDGINGATGQITGSFVYNGSAITSWDITVPEDSIYRSPNTFPQVTFTEGNSSEFGSYLSEPEFATSSGGTLDLYFDVGPSDLSTPGTYNDANWFEDYQATSSSYIEADFGGTLVGTAETPEPATWALLGTGGLMLLGLAWRRRGSFAMGRYTGV